VVKGRNTKCRENCSGKSPVRNAEGEEQLVPVIRRLGMNAPEGASLAVDWATHGKASMGIWKVEEAVKKAPGCVEKMGRRKDAPAGRDC
jgi:hypothetical protein